MRIHSAKVGVFNSLHESFHHVKLGSDKGGCELWDSLKNSKMSFKSFEITFHKCIKRLLGVPQWFGNHDACYKIGVLTLRHSEFRYD